MRALYTVGLMAVLAFVINAAPVQAQGTIRYVSAGGSDGNNCTFALPCRTLQRAVDVVPARGVVQALNSAGYGNVTIGKSVTVSGGGNVVALGTRIRIDNANAKVVLRELVMDGRGATATGILISNAAAVHIEGCAIERFTSDGIVLDRASELFVADSVSRGNGGDGLHVAATVKVTVDNSRFENNRLNGMLIADAESTIARSIASGNGMHGMFQIRGETNVTGTTTAHNVNHGISQSGGSMSVTWSTAANNGNSGYYVDDTGEMALEYSVGRGNAGAGVGVDPGAFATVSNSVMTHNSTGMYNGGGTLWTRENNTVFLNSSFDTDGTISPLAAK